MRKSGAFQEPWSGPEPLQRGCSRDMMCGSFELAGTREGAHPLSPFGFSPRGRIPAVRPNRSK